MMADRSQKNQRHSLLLVDDDPEILMLLQAKFKDQPFEIFTAIEGGVVLDIVRTEKPDLIVADIMMPFITGLELIAFIRKDMRSALPVIVISALEHEDTVLEAFRLGATDFITKPFKPNELVLRIKRIFQDSDMT